MFTCSFCSDKKYWEDHVAMRTFPCPFCNAQATPSRQPADHLVKELSIIAAKHHGPLFQTKPWLLVLHCGAKGSGIAEFFRDAGEIARPEGALKVSAHISWSDTLDDYALTVPLNYVAWHCGGSMFRGQRKLNFCSIGIELPGPPTRKRSEDELAKLESAMSILLRECPSLKIGTRHSDIDPHKLDPGVSFEWSMLKNFGLELPFERNP